MSEEFWRELMEEMNPTTSAPMFVIAEFVSEHLPIPDWLSYQFDLLRNGYYIGVDRPEDREARVARLRAVLERSNYFD